MNAVTRYLRSPRNLVGGILGLAGFAASWGLQAGPEIIPIATVGLYGLGALLTPTPGATAATADTARASGKRRTLRPGSSEDLTALQTELQALVDDTDHKRSRLPHDAYVAFHDVVALLREILTRAKELATSAENLYVVSATIRDYLPTSIGTFLALPTGFSPEQAATAQKGHDELLAHMLILKEEMGRVRGSLYSGDLQALQAQGLFLAEKFKTSGLDSSG